MTDASDVEDNRICWRCIGEPFLRAKVRKDGEVEDCDYCGNSAKTVSIDELADEVRGGFDRHYIRTPTGPPEHEAYMHHELNLDYDRPGEPAADAVAAAAGLDETPAEHVRAVLEAGTVLTVDEYFDRDGDDEADFSEEAQYEERDIDASAHFRGWQRFKTSLRTEARLFNSKAQDTLDSIFSGLDGHATRTGRGVVVDAGPGQSHASLYRARYFQSREKVEECLERPDLHLGPPPSQVATAGRMNAQGIAVFYGATHEDAAIAESRPAVGSHVIVGRFDIIRALKLLDVEALRAIFVKGSIFDPSFLDRQKKAAFLSHLSHQITLPVMPDDEPFEYLVTQAIADYLANLRSPELDGLIYRSVQHGKGRRNVVLFHKSGRVKELEFPRGTSISAHTSTSDDEGSKPDFRVYETVPGPNVQDEVEDPYDFGPVLRSRSDHRQPALSIDTESIHVHRIERAEYRRETFKVPRFRTIRSVNRVRRII